MEIKYLHEVEMGLLVFTDRVRGVNICLLICIDKLDMSLDWTRVFQLDVRAPVTLFQENVQVLVCCRFLASLCHVFPMVMLHLVDHEENQEKIHSTFYHEYGVQFGTQPKKHQFLTTLEFPCTTLQCQTSVFVDFPNRKYYLQNHADDSLLVPGSLTSS